MLDPAPPSSPMSDDIAEAVRIAQERCLTTTSSAKLARLELALDYLLRNPAAVGDPAHLLDNALANARAKLRRRSAVVEVTTSDVAVEYADSLGNTSAFAGPQTSTEPFEITVIDAMDTVRHSSLPPAAKALLLFTLADVDPEWSGRHLGIPTQRARERLSRARSQARRIPGFRSDLLVAA